MSQLYENLKNSTDMLNELIEMEKEHTILSSCEWNSPINYKAEVTGTGKGMDFILQLDNVDTFTPITVGMKIYQKRDNCFGEYCRALLGGGFFCIPSSQIISLNKGISYDIFIPSYDFKEEAHTPYPIKNSTYACFNKGTVLGDNFQYRGLPRDYPGSGQTMTINQIPNYQNEQFNIAVTPVDGPAGSGLGGAGPTLTVTQDPVEPGHYQVGHSFTVVSIQNNGGKGGSGFVKIRFLLNSADKLVLEEDLFP